MDPLKVAFLKKDFIFHLKHLAPDAQPKWGVMNGQQMVEHFSDVVRLASGELKINREFPADKVARNYAFLLSEEPFKENTKSPLVPVVPPPPVHATMQQSIEALQNDINYFFEVFENTSDLRTYNPVFGHLNFDEQVQLLYKHARHHLRQFGLID